MDIGQYTHHPSNGQVVEHAKKRFKYLARKKIKQYNLKNIESFVLVRWVYPLPGIRPCIYLYGKVHNQYTTYIKTFYYLPLI